MTSSQSTHKMLITRAKCFIQINGIQTLQALLQHSDTLVMLAGPISTWELGGYSCCGCEASRGYKWLTLTKCESLYISLQSFSLVCNSLTNCTESHESRATAFRLSAKYTPDLLSNSWSNFFFLFCKPLNYQQSRWRNHNSYSFRPLQGALGIFYTNHVCSEKHLNIIYQSRIFHHVVSRISEGFVRGPGSSCCRIIHTLCTILRFFFQYPASYLTYK